MTYEERAEELVRRIVALGPQVLAVDGAFKLFRIPEFFCADLDLTLAQADAALAKAKSMLATAGLSG